MAKKIGDLLSIGLILISIFLMSLAFRQEGIIRIIGLAGSLILIIVEGYYLLNLFRKRQ